MIPSSGKLFLSVGSDILVNQTPEWSKSRCQLLDEKIVAARGAGSQGVCASAALTPDLDKTLSAAKASGSYVAHLHLLERANGAIQLTATDWTANVLDLEKEQFIWNLESPALVGQDRQEQALLKLTRNFLVYVGNKKAIRENIVRSAAPLSETVFVGQSGAFLDKQGRYPITGTQAVESFKKESEKHKHFLRTTLEITAVLAIGDVFYWLGQEEMKQDWEYAGTSSDQKRKLISGDGYRFDNNPIYFNFGHAFAGMLYYDAARANGYTALESFLFAFAGSAVWESVAEYREVLSLSDMVVTPVGGAIIGEVVYQIGHFFTRSSNTRTHRYLGRLFGGVERLNLWVSKSKPKVADELDASGYPADTWHDFKYWVGLRNFSPDNSKSMTTANLGADLEVFNVRSYDKPGEVATFMSDTAFAKFVAETSLGSEGVKDVFMLAKTAIAGYYQQNIGLDEQGRKNGYSFYIGEANRIDFRLRSEEAGPSDMQCMVGVLGSTLRMTMFVRGVRIRMNVDVYADFAMIRNYALDDYVATHGEEHITGVEAMDKYAYGWAINPEGSIAVQYKRLEIGLSYLERNTHSIDTLDQTVEDEFNYHSEESYKEGKLTLTYSLSDRVQLRFSYEDARREGSFEDHKAKLREKSYSGAVVYLF